MTSDDRTLAAGIARPRATDQMRASDYATLRSRMGGYVVDMVILSAIAMLVLVGAGFLLLWMIDFGEQDPSNKDMYVFAGLLGLGVPVIWSALNLALLRTRAQTGGQYVAALRLKRADGSPLSTGTASAWWFWFNPLLFSWPMAFIAGIPMLLTAGLVNSTIALAASMLVIVLCLVMPVVALVSSALDARNRALHDRVAGTVVVPT